MPRLPLCFLAQEVIGEPITVWIGNDRKQIVMQSIGHERSSHDKSLIRLKGFISNLYKIVLRILKYFGKRHFKGIELLNRVLHF